MCGSTGHVGFVVELNYSPDKQTSDERGLITKPHAPESYWTMKSFSKLSTQRPRLMMVMFAKCGGGKYIVIWFWLLWSSHGDVEVDVMLMMR